MRSEIGQGGGRIWPKGIGSGKTKLDKLEKSNSPVHHEHKSYF